MKKFIVLAVMALGGAIAGEIVGMILGGALMPWSPPPPPPIYRGFVNPNPVIIVDVFTGWDQEGYGAGKYYVACSQGPYYYLPGMRLGPNLVIGASLTNTCLRKGMAVYGFPAGFSVPRVD